MLKGGTRIAVENGALNHEVKQPASARDHTPRTTPQGADWQISTHRATITGGGGDDSRFFFFWRGRYPRSSTRGRWYGLFLGRGGAPAGQSSWKRFRRDPEETRKRARRGPETTPLGRGPNPKHPKPHHRGEEGGGEDHPSPPVPSLPLPRTPPGRREGGVGSGPWISYTKRYVHIFIIIFQIDRCINICLTPPALLPPTTHPPTHPHPPRLSTHTSPTHTGEREGGRERRGLWALDYTYKYIHRCFTCFFHFSLR